MDIILEVVDTFALDALYAKILPAGPPLYELYNAYNNATRSAAASTWKYEPATSLFSLQPSDAAYMSSWQRDNPWRQYISLFFIVWFFGIVLYFSLGTLSYIYVFDKTTFKHPKFLKNQIKMEMRQANEAMPLLSLLTAGAFWLEVRGYSKLFDSTADGPGRWYTVLQFPFFLVFTDFWIYLIHRGLHSKMLYKRLHKPHHKWIMPTPYASHAFHPLDGFAQSIPYHVFPFLFPLQKMAYVGLFVFVNVWTVIIHDGEYVSNSPVINGAACHTMHHLYFNYNYGQYTTLWDRLGGSYRPPNVELFNRESKMGQKEWDRQTKEMESIVKEVEGNDDRSYGLQDELKMSLKKDL